MVILLLGLALMPVVAVAPMLRRLVAVGCGSAVDAALGGAPGAVMKHAGHRAMRHTRISPSDEEAEQHCCQKAEKAHTCRWVIAGRA